MLLSAIAIVGSRSGCTSCCCCGVLVAIGIVGLPLALLNYVSVALGGKVVMVTKMLIEDVSTLLMLLKDC